ncbi:MAG: GntR family transcriptional regulator [Acidobacteriota bacterium]
MEIVIDIEAPEPLFAQLIEQIKSAIGAGALSPGDPLPSIRQLARDLEVNNKTVAKAYRLLERDAVLETKGYRGTFVHREAHANCGRDLGTEVREALEQAIASLRDQGVTDSEIRIAFSEVMGRREAKRR